VTFRSVVPHGPAPPVASDDRYRRCATCEPPSPSARKTVSPTCSSAARLLSRRRCAVRSLATSSSLPGRVSSRWAVGRDAHTRARPLAGASPGVGRGVPGASPRSAVSRSSDSDYSATCGASVSTVRCNGVNAVMAGAVDDRCLGRRFPALVSGAGVAIAVFRSQGFAETTDAGYMLTVIDRGADLLESREPDRGGAEGGAQVRGTSSADGWRVLRAHCLRKLPGGQAIAPTAIPSGVPAARVRAARR
jgi:hypothetical protein